MEEEIKGELENDRKKGFCVISLNLNYNEIKLSRISGL